MQFSQISYIQSKLQQNFDKQQVNTEDSTLQEGKNNDSYINHDTKQNNDTEQIISSSTNQQESLTKKKYKKTIFLVVALTVIIIFGVICYFYKYPSQKPFWYNGVQLDSCPNNTYIYNNEMCFDECPKGLFYRQKYCVQKCEDNEFQIDNYCANNSCEQEEDFSEKEDKFLDKNNNITKSRFYDISNHQCVDQCSKAQFLFFGEFCFEKICNKEQIVSIISQYISKRESQVIEMKQYDSIAYQFKNINEYELIVQENEQNKICSLGCQNINKEFVIFNDLKEIHECASSCKSNHYIYKKGNQNICFDECPSNTFISLDKYECIESCGNLLIQQQNCVENCFVNQVIDENKCVYQCPYSKPYINKNNNCVNSCLNDMQTPYVKDGRCVKQCENYISPISGKQNEYQCVDQCKILPSQGNVCIEQCSKDEVEVIQNNQRKCFKIQKCEDQSQYYVNGEGCKNNCPDNYPIKFVQQCLNKCFDNYYLFNQICLKQCPQQAPYIQESECVKNCSSNYYLYQDKCFKNCPNNLFQNIQDQTCIEKCSGFITLPQRDCYKKCPTNFPYQHHNECIQKCPDYHYINQESDQLSCVLQCPSKMFIDTENNNCVKQCPKNLFIDNQIKRCFTSCKKKPNNNFLCEDMCKNNERYIASNQKCVSLCPTSHFKHEEINECLIKCPSYFYKSSEGENICASNCTSIQKLLFDDQCFNECPKYLENNACTESCSRLNPFIEDKKCVYKCSQNKIIHSNQCLDQCPENLFYVQDIKQCQETCPTGYAHIKDKLCKSQCHDLILDEKYCVQECPFNSINLKNSCYSNNQNINGPYLNQSGEIIDNCDFDKGYYTNQRVCKKCKGGDGCQKCSQFFGLCIQCKQSFSLFNNECITSCPEGYIDKSGFCIKNDQFLRENLFFREYSDSQYLKENQKIQFSILQNVGYLNQLGDQIKQLNILDEQNQQFSTVIVHFHDLNSTYLDFYSYSLNYGNEEDQREILNNLKSAVIDHKLTILTIQSIDIFYSDNIFQLILNELLLSVGYFKCNVVFSDFKFNIKGVGYSANSIQKHVSSILLEQRGKNNLRNVFGNYLIDLQFNLVEKEILRELQNNQLKEIQSFPKLNQDLDESHKYDMCQFLQTFLKIGDITYLSIEQTEIKQNQSLTDKFIHFIQSNGCQGQSLGDNEYQIEKDDVELQQQKFNSTDFFSEQRKTIINKYIAKHLIQDVVQWKNKTNNQI